MTVLGIDPGTAQIGYGVIKHERNRISCLAYGTIGDKNLDPLTNLVTAEAELSKLIERYKPDTAGVEKLFFFKNQKTVMAVSEMRGVILFTLARHRVPVQQFTPLQVKQNISSYGKAGKDQVQRMVKLLLNLEEPVKPDDAADALAIAICCSHNIIPV